MIHENELVTLLISLGVLLFGFHHRRHLVGVPAWPVLVIAFLTQLGAWILTVAEDVYPLRVLNLLEHLCYLVSAGLLVFWLVRLIESHGRGETA